MNMRVENPQQQQQKQHNDIKANIIINRYNV